MGQPRRPVDVSTGQGGTELSRHRSGRSFVQIGSALQPNGTHYNEAGGHEGRARPST